jgi:sporulation protein YqfC
MNIRTIGFKGNKPENISKLPLVEIAGEKRVLVENHLGVIGYSSEEIQIRVCYGVLSVSGSGLQFAQINREQLVICGRVDCVSLLRR